MDGSHKPWLGLAKNGNAGSLPQGLTTSRKTQKGSVWFGWQSPIMELELVRDFESLTSTHRRLDSATLELLMVRGGGLV